MAELFQEIMLDIFIFFLRCKMKLVQLSNRNECTLSKWKVLCKKEKKKSWPQKLRRKVGNIMDKRGIETRARANKHTLIFLSKS